jgi:hypothetical protein
MKNQKTILVNIMVREKNKIGGLILWKYATETLEKRLEKKTDGWVCHRSTWIQETVNWSLTKE